MNMIELNEECRRCAFLEDGCGREWTPQIHIGDSGHCEGCMDYAPKADADGACGEEVDDGE